MDEYGYTDKEHRLANVMSVLSYASVIATLLACVIAVWNPITTLDLTTAYTPYAVAALGMMTLLAWIASVDVRRFRVMVHVITAGFLFGALCFGALSLVPANESQSWVLLIASAISLILSLFIGWTSLQARPNPDAPVARSWVPDKPVTAWERLGQLVCGLLGIAALSAAVLSLLLPHNPPAGMAELFDLPAVVALGSVGLGLLAACLLIASSDVRTYNDLLLPFMLDTCLTILVAALMLARFSNEPGQVNHLSLIRIGLWTNTAVLVLVFAVRNRMARAKLDYLQFFTPFQFHALEGIAETLIAAGRLSEVTPYQVSLRTDSYLATIHAARTRLARLAVMGIDLSSLLWLRPPISFLNPDLRREFFDRHFKREMLEPSGILRIIDRLGPRILLDLLEGGMRFNMQLAYIGYYSDPRVHAKIGYTPFSARAREFPIHPLREHPPLNVMTPEVLNRLGVDVISSADVVVIGTGAGGAILAEQLANQGREVILLDKGAYVSPDEFSEDEVDMIGRLYNDGALQISQSLRFTILQGNAVGGTTVVNNAVCFDTPDGVLELWNDASGINAGIEIEDFKAAQQAVRKRLNIQPILNSSLTRPGEEVLNPGDVVLQQGIEAVFPSRNFKYDVVEANITDCLGCGYCNIGCKYGRKLSMLDRVLPAAQRAHGEDKFRILSETEAVRLGGQNGHINEIEARVKGKRQLFIRNPKTVVVSAGAIASSWLLMRSGIGQGELPIGRWLCFNMGSPLHAWFGRKLNSYAGLQISHYLALGDHPGFVYETWYNPPVAQALSMPGWLDTHHQNMQRYAEMIGVGVLVGTEPNPESRLKRALFLPGMPDIVYTPTPRDLDTLATALVILGKIMLAAGAKEIFASTRKYQSYSSVGAQREGRALATVRSDRELNSLSELIHSERDILLGTGHPQGGNRISKNRGRNGVDGGVVDPGFKVYGYDNLYVCDASVHPTATTVNPQLTVMTLAQYAANRIDAG